MNQFDPKQPVFSNTGEKPPFIRVVFPSPALEVAAGGPVAGQTVEEYVRLGVLPKELRDRVVLYIRESMRG